MLVDEWSSHYLLESNENTIHRVQGSLIVGHGMGALAVNPTKLLGT